MEDNNYEQFIVDSIEKLSGKYTPYQIFSDWITMTTMAISNAYIIILQTNVYRTLAAVVKIFIVRQLRG